MQCFIKCMFISESSFLCLTRANKQLEVRLQCTYWMSNDERICIHLRDPRLTLISHLYSYHAPLGMSKQNNPVGVRRGGASESTSQSESVKASQSVSFKSVNMHSLVGVMAAHLIVRQKKVVSEINSLLDNDFSFTYTSLNSVVHSPHQE